MSDPNLLYAMGNLSQYVFYRNLVLYSEVYYVFR
jgi:hypothetical protein